MDAIIPKLGHIDLCLNVEVKRRMVSFSFPYKDQSSNAMEINIKNDIVNAI